jgi:hypothetical protein
MGKKKPKSKKVLADVSAQAVASEAEAVDAAPEEVAPAEEAADMAVAAAEPEAQAAASEVEAVDAAPEEVVPEEAADMAAATAAPEAQEAAPAVEAVEALPEEVAPAEEAADMAVAAAEPEAQAAASAVEAVDAAPEEVAPAEEAADMAVAAAEPEAQAAASEAEAVEALPEEAAPEIEDLVPQGADDILPGDPLGAPFDAQKTASPQGQGATIEDLAPGPLEAPVPELVDIPSHDAVEEQAVVAKDRGALQVEQTPAKRGKEKQGKKKGTGQKAAKDNAPPPIPKDFAWDTNEARYYTRQGERASVAAPFWARRILMLKLYHMQKTLEKLVSKNKSYKEVSEHIGLVYQEVGAEIMRMLRESSMQEDVPENNAEKRNITE